ncbi:MAG: diguanylate cyclase [Propionibacteriales bacterium]|nr:diguanylate cyclase [Propionibacteriales bacterium]
MTGLTLSTLRDLQRLILRVNAGPDLDTTLKAVVDGVVEGLGFGVAVVNLVRDDDTVEVVAVAGSDDATRALLGGVGTVNDWHQALAVADEHGGVRFVPHDRFIEDEGLPTWVPDLPVSDDPDDWHPLDALFAPLHSVSGQLIGVLSVDLPRDGRKPGPEQCELLEMFAVQASIAIDNARLTDALRREQGRLEASEQAFRLAFEAAPMGMSVVDMRDDPGRFLRVNAALCRLLGYSREKLLASSLRDISHADRRDDDVTAIQRAIDGKQDSYCTEKRYSKADGESIWLSLNTSVVRDGDGRALYGITQLEDISDRRKAHLELVQRARIDPLTGLLNRSSLLERVDEAIVKAQHTGRPGALLFCDLDGFKPVNDQHGHCIGDQVLAVVARRLESQVRAGDTAARFGGDEFVVVADGLAGSSLDELVSRLRSAVARPIHAGDIDLSVSMTVGQVAIAPDGTDSPAELLAEADAAMYLLKPKD